MDRTLVEDVLDEELDRSTAHPMIGLELADESELISSFDPGEHFWGERSHGILTDTKLELAVRAPFPHARCLDDIRIDKERRRRVALAKRPEALQVLD